MGLYILSRYLVSFQYLKLQQVLLCLSVVI